MLDFNKQKGNVYLPGIRPENRNHSSWKEFNSGNWVLTKPLKDMKGNLSETTVFFQIIKIQKLF